MKSEFRADTAKLLELANENERLRANLSAARELIDDLNCHVDSWSATDDLKDKAHAFLERSKSMTDLPGLFEPIPGERAADKEIRRLRTELTAAREVIEPLLDHYLNCYEGNADRLVYDARAFLERTMPRPESLQVENATHLALAQSANADLAKARELVLKLWAEIEDEGMNSDCDAEVISFLESTAMPRPG